MSKCQHYNLHYDLDVHTGLAGAGGIICMAPPGCWCRQAQVPCSGLLPLLPPLQWQDHIPFLQLRLRRVCFALNSKINNPWIKSGTAKMAWMTLEKLKPIYLAKSRHA